MAGGHQSEVEEGISGHTGELPESGLLVVRTGRWGTQARGGAGQRAHGSADGRWAPSGGTYYALGPILTTCGPRRAHPANEEADAPSPGVRGSQVRGREGGRGSGLSGTSNSPSKQHPGPGRRSQSGGHLVLCTSRCPRPGVGRLVPAKSHVDIYDIIRRPDKTIPCRGSWLDLVTHSMHSPRTPRHGRTPGTSCT